MKVSGFRVLVIMGMLLMAMACGEDGDDTTTDGDSPADGDASACALQDSCIADLLGDAVAQNCFFELGELACMTAQLEGEAMVFFADGRSLKPLCSEQDGVMWCDNLIRIDDEKCGMMKTATSTNSVLQEARYILDASGDSYRIVYADTGVAITCPDDTEEAFSAEQLADCMATLPLPIPEQVSGCAAQAEPLAPCEDASACTESDRNGVCISGFCGYYD